MNGRFGSVRFCRFGPLVSVGSVWFGRFGRVGSARGRQLLPAAPLGSGTEAIGTRQYSIVQYKRYIRKLSRNLARTYFGLNLSFIAFTFYSSDLLIGVGFVTSVTFTTHLSNTKLLAFQSELFLFQNAFFFFKVDVFSIFSPNPYTRMCVLTIRSFSLLRKK